MAEKSSFESIMNEITGGLTGNYDADLQYLEEQEQKYKDHEQAKEILRAIGRLIYEITPEEKKKELSQTTQNVLMGFDAALEEAKFNIYKKEYNKALEILEDMVQKYEEQALFENDSVSEYYCFHEPMEEILYRQRNQSEREVRHVNYNFDAMYYFYGSLLLELQRFEDAEKALEKARRWNPVDPALTFEYAETFKIRGMIKEFAEITRNAFRYAFRPTDLARCYRNMGYFFVELQDYHAAVCCYLFSEQFEKSKNVSSELYYISQTTGENYQPTFPEIRETFERLELPVGPAMEILQIGYAYGKHFFENGDYASAKYYLEIVSAFADLDEVNEMLRRIMETQ